MLAALALVVAGCSKKGGDPDPTPTPNQKTNPMEEKIPISISVGQMTKATETAFEAGDKVGIYVVNESGGVSQTLQTSGNHANNVGYTYSDSWTPDTQVYWLDETTKADFYCYYPYASSIADVTAVPLSVNADQGTEASLRASDFLFGTKKGVAPTSDPVSITVYHSMASFEISLKAGTGWSEDDIKGATVTILGLRTSGTLDMTSGAVTADGTASDIIPLADGLVRKVLVMPQEVSNQDLVKVQVQGNQYVLNQSINFASNKKYSCELIINRTSEGLNIGIGDWDEDGTDYGGTLE